MDERDLQKALSKLPLGGLQTFDKTGSTNDVALAWAINDAPDLALVWAEEQTSGRGRGNRSWFTPPGSALAFSLVLRPLPGEERLISFFSGLGALAVCEALESLGLHPEIKWPNDVLLNRRKVCGVLTEVAWMGEKPVSIVMGIGVNVKPEAVPPPAQLNFPATCIETELGKSMDRLSLLKDILERSVYWRGHLTTEAFTNDWENHLAFAGEQVEIQVEGFPPRTGRVVGLEPDGSLRLQAPDRQIFTIQFGEVHLRPVL
jgi:BirA family biotin operon repressor/biotin-[acetyl-CoA-carboxylase] ligase